MNISLGHMPFIAVEINTELDDKVNIWADNDKLSPEVVARMVIALRAIADAWEARLTDNGKAIGDLLSKAVPCENQKYGTIVNLTVAYAGAPSLASQCAEGHPFWEGPRTSSFAEAQESLSVHNYAIHGVTIDA